MARILFVDDDPFTLETLNRAVQVFGHQALLANNGKEAIALAAEFEPDLIVVDMMLPDMDGLDLVLLLHGQEATAGIPAVMLTADADLDTAKRAREMGARDFLRKPIRLQTLMDTIQKYTEK